MPVDAAHLVRVRGAQQFTGQQVGAQRLARARRSDGENGDQIARLDDAGPDARGQGQRDGGDVASRNRDAPAAPERLTLGAAGREEQLGQAVVPGAEELAAVERLPRRGVGETVIGAAIHDQRVGRQITGDLTRLTVRQRQEHDVMASESRRIRRLQLKVGERPQVRLNGTQQLAGVLERGHGGDREIGVRREQSQHLTPGVAAGTSDGNRQGHGSTLLRDGRGDDAAGAQAAAEKTTPGRRRDTA